MNAAPKGKVQKTLRQRDCIWTKLWKAIAPTKPNLSGTKTERMNIICSCAFFDIRTMDTGHVCIRVSFKKSARYKQGGGMVSEAETGHMDVFVMKGIRICP